MKVIAFFDLKESTDIKVFHEWVLKTQTPVFRRRFPKMKNFRVMRLSEADNYENPLQIVQIFDWEGTADDWRKALENIRDTGNEETRRLVQEWLAMCSDESTRILYAEDIGRI